MCLIGVRQMALFKWGEITTIAWIISLVISAGIVLMVLPYSKQIIATLQLAWLMLTGDWTDGW